MKNRSTSIPLGMATRSFYCHKCGAQLGRVPRTRTVRRGDPDYKKYNRVGRMITFGDVEVTEYDFRCTACDRITGYDDQCVIEYIQQQSGTHILSQSEIAAKTKEARAVLEGKKRRTNMIGKAIFIAVTLIALYFKLRG